MPGTEKTYRLNVRLNESQLNDFLTCFDKSNFRTKSEYICHLLHNTKIVQLPIFGADDILNELISVKKQIEGIAVNVNQMARHLNESRKDAILGYNVTKMLEYLPRIMDLQKELDQKTKTIQKAYVDYINKLYQDDRD